MLSALTDLLSFIVAISILVAVHEYGHYLVGRWTGMKVLRFSIGFGKPIWTHIGAGEDRTEYCISAIPLGGYVRFLDDREGPVEPRDEGRAFNHRPIPARIAVLMAGPMFNFLFAILVYWALFVYGIPSVKPAIGEVVPDSYAAEAGLQPGDRIIAVGDRDTASWDRALLAMLDEMTGDGRVPLTLENEDGELRETVIDVGADKTRLTEPGLLFDGLGFDPYRPPVLISGLDPADGPAARAGLQQDDRILAIDGERVRSIDELGPLLAPRPNETVRVDYLRDGQPGSVELTLLAVEVEGQTVGRMGVQITGDWGDLAYLRKFGPLESISRAVDRMWSSTVFTVTMLGRMITGDVSIKNISGPINIAQFAGASAERGIDDFVDFLAIVSISLGVLNLLPIPVLDGGQIVYQLIEWMKGSPLSERAQIVGQQVGILALILLMSFAFYNDIARIIG